MKIKSCRRFVEGLLKLRKSSALENVIPVSHHEEITAKLQAPTTCVSSADSFDKLAEQVASLVKHYDAMATKMSDDNMKALLADMSSHLINSLILGGCEPIADDIEFNINRHMPVPFIIVEQGTPIQSVTRIGVANHGKVLIPALVKL